MASQCEEWRKNMQYVDIEAYLRQHTLQCLSLKQLGLGTISRG